MTRRYYRIRALENVRAFREDDRPYVTGSFELGGDRLELISALTDYDDLPHALLHLNEMAGKAQQPGNVVTDLYLAWPDAPEDGDLVSSISRHSRPAAGSPSRCAGWATTRCSSSPSGRPGTVGWRRSR